jgi:EXS family
VKLFPSDDAFVLFTQFLEVLRRALWNLLRVEWENLKQSGQHHHHIAKPMTPASASIQMTSMNNNNISNGNNDEEITSFLRSSANANKLGKW